MANINEDFVRRLDRAFEGATMAVVARRLGIPHATVRNYYQGRLPAPDVLIKIAGVTGVSLNWLLMGRGEMYVGDTEPIGLGRFIEAKIGEMIDRRLANLNGDVEDLGSIDVLEEFDIDASVLRLGDPQAIMNEWFAYEDRPAPSDYGIVFFRGWETFSHEQKVEAIRDAKRVLDRSLN
ncbi:MAG: helix-turn-helix domain-containing protein [Pyrinomonadaceae bacterium]